MSRVIESVLDEPRTTLATDLFDERGNMMGDVREYIIRSAAAYTKWGNLRGLYLMGSSAGFQYTEESDLDLAFVINPTDEAAWKDSRKYANRTQNQATVPGTRHAANFYAIRHGDTLPDGPVYDVLRNKWVRRPERSGPLDLSHYAQLYSAVVHRLDSETGTLRRSLIDFDIVSQADPDELEDLQDLAKEKLHQIDINTRRLALRYRALHVLRTMAYRSDIDPETLRKYGEREKLPGNVIYKMLERYRYIQLLRAVKLALYDAGGRVRRPEDVASVKKAVGESIPKWDSYAESVSEAKRFIKQITGALLTAKMKSMYGIAEVPDAVRWIGVDGSWLAPEADHQETAEKVLKSLGVHAEDSEGFAENDPDLLLMLAGMIRCYIVPEGGGRAHLSISLASMPTSEQLISIKTMLNDIAGVLVYDNVGVGGTLRSYSYERSLDELLADRKLRAAPYVIKLRAGDGALYPEVIESLIDEMTGTAAVAGYEKPMRALPQRKRMKRRRHRLKEEQGRESLYARVSGLIGGVSDRMEGDKAWLTPDGMWINTEEHRDVIPFDSDDDLDIGVQDMAKAGFVRVAWEGGAINSLHAEYSRDTITSAQRRELKNTAIERGGEVMWDPGYAWGDMPMHESVNVDPSPFLKVYKAADRGLEPEREDLIHCLMILQDYYSDYLDWYKNVYWRSKRDAKDRATNRRIEQDYQKRAIEVYKALAIKSMPLMITAVDNGINQWHLDYPAVYHMQMDAEDEKVEAMWEQVVELLDKLRRLPRQSPYKGLPGKLNQ